MVVTHVVLELVAARELLLAHGAPEGGLGHAVQGGAQLAAALSRVDHVFYLQETRCHLNIVGTVTSGGDFTEFKFTFGLILGLRPETDSLYVFLFYQL